MFVDSVIKNNMSLLKEVIELHKCGRILPDSYVIDVDTFVDNAKIMLEKARSLKLKMYFMLKQVGRNPYLAKKLIETGYESAVVVDFKEAQIMMENDIPLGNVGHLVQTPKHLLKKVIDYGAEVITVYTYEKMAEINEAAKESNKVQDILIRVYDDGDSIYSGQEAGITLTDLEGVVRNANELKNIKIVGVTSFPCFLYDDEINDFRPTHNLETVLKAKEILIKNNIDVKEINLPSTTCCRTLDLLKKYGGTHGEPGHGLSASTPLHAKMDLKEKPCVVYVSEVSHNFKDHGYVYGGGIYRRGHMENCLVGENLEHYHIKTPDIDSIDYHFVLDRKAKVSDIAIMAFRFQIFVTRSTVVLIEGLKTGTPHIVGVYDSEGHRMRGDFDE